MTPDIDTLVTTVHRMAAQQQCRDLVLAAAEAVDGSDYTASGAQPAGARSGWRPLRGGQYDPFVEWAPC